MNNYDFELTRAKSGEYVGSVLREDLTEDLLRKLGVAPDAESVILAGEYTVQVNDGIVSAIVTSAYLEHGEASIDITSIIDTLLIEREIEETVDASEGFYDDVSDEYYDSYIDGLE